MHLLTKETIFSNSRCPVQFSLQKSILSTIPNLTNSVRDDHLENFF